MADDSSIQGAIDNLESVASISGSLDNVLAKSIFIPITTFFASMAGLVYSILNVPISLFDALAEVSALLVEAIFGGGAEFIGTSWTVSAQAFMGGIWDQFGPFTIVIAAGIFLAIFYMFASYRAMEVTGNVIPGFSDIPAWFPLVGQDEDES